MLMKDACSRRRHFAVARPAWRWRRRTDIPWQVPGGLAFADFRGYEDWQVVAVSHNGDKIAIILGNPSDDRGLQGGYSRQRQAFPGRRQDGENPLDGEEG